MTHTFILPLDALAGPSVKDIAADMIAVAKRFSMPVSLAMNGTRLPAFPDTALRELRADYERQLMASQEVI